MRDFKSFLPDASIEFSSEEQIDQQPLIDEQIPLQQNGIQNECEGENIQEGNVEIIQFDQNNSVNTSVAMDSNVTNNTTVKKRSNTTTTAAEYLSQKVF